MPTLTNRTSPIPSDTATTDLPSVSPAPQQLLSVEEIQQLLPHRYPFLLLDRIIENLPGERAVGIKNVTVNEPFFQGHFPGRPIMPGVLIVEAMAQVGGVVLAQMPDMRGKLCLFAGIDKVRFRRPVVPGDQLVLTVELLTIKQRRFWQDAWSCGSGWTTGF